MNSRSIMQHLSSLVLSASHSLKNIRCWALLFFCLFSACSRGSSVVASNVFGDDSSNGSNGVQKYDVNYSSATFFRDCAGRESEKLFVLSFDDGPHESVTEGLLDVLNDKAAPATFFWIGSNWQRRPELATHYDQLAMRVLFEGHILANHGMTNDPFEVEEVEECHETISQKGNGYQPHFFRPAQGAYIVSKLEEIRQIFPKYRTAMWNFDTDDWRSDRDPYAILELLEYSLDHGSEMAPVADKANHGYPRRGSFVMLAHDNHDTFLKPVENPDTGEVVPLLSAAIDLIRSKGYTIVSMDECLGIEPESFKPPESYCGSSWVDANTMCSADSACPTGSDLECPTGLKCYGDIPCSVEPASRQDDDEKSDGAPSASIDPWTYDGVFEYSSSSQIWPWKTWAVVAMMEVVLQHLL